MSTDFYARLEQRRGARPSEQMIGAIARALRLTEDERDHLLVLSGHTPPPRTHRTDHVSPALLRVLDRLDAPAQVVSDLGATLRQNPLAESLVGVQTGYSGPERSLFYRWFTDPAERRRYHEDDHDLHARSYVATLRAVHGRRDDDREAQEIVDLLLRASPQFADLWGHHEVAVRSATRKRMIHPVVGLIELDCQTLRSENQAQALLVFTATPGTEDAERLALLSVIGSQTFAPAAAL
jgi:hypothetical protein